MHLWPRLFADTALADAFQGISTGDGISPITGTGCPADVLPESLRKVAVTGATIPIWIEGFRHFRKRPQEVLSLALTIEE